MKPEGELVEYLDRLLRERVELTTHRLNSNVSTDANPPDRPTWSLTPRSKAWVSSVTIDRRPGGSLTFTLRDAGGGALTEAESIPRVRTSPETNGFSVNGKRLTPTDLADLLWSYLTRPVRDPPSRDRGG